MLNELLVVERGARRAGLPMDELHADIKSAGRVPTLVVRLGRDGCVDSVHPLPDSVVAWTLRDGQQDSFPFVQPKAPLWVVTRRASDPKENLRDTILRMARDARISADSVKGWASARLLARVQKRLEVLKSGQDGSAATAVAAMERFCVAARDGLRLAEQIAERLVRELRQTAQDDWIRVAAALLLGQGGRRRAGQAAGAAILFDAAGAAVPIYHRDVAAGVSIALRAADVSSAQQRTVGICALTGERGQLVTGNFPQPTLPVLGQTFLFARNPKIPSGARYRRLGAASIPVAEGTAIRLAAAVRTLTRGERKGRTWRPVPGERPRQTDLLLAFVDDDPLAPIADILADDGAAERDDAADGPAASAAATIAAFEARTHRIVGAVQGKADSDFRASPVRLVVLRKVDPGNRKVVYAGRMSVSDLYEAALAWACGERCVPSWMTLPVKVNRGASLASPPHVSPLGLVAFTRAVFRRGGTDRSEAVGIPSSAAMRLFLDHDRRLATRILRLVLARRASLGAGAAHAARGGRQSWRAFDTCEALRTVSVLGVLLNKLGKEDPMSGAAFRLGQLLAVADVVHAGYCADVRNGDTPPSLLGNQVFTLAQRSPATALAALGRRWKPYGGWLRRADRIHQKASALVDSKKPEEAPRGRAMRRAVRQGREVQSICASLAAELQNCVVDDLFRAELLLGYMAGLPQSSPGSASDGAHDDQED